LAGTVEPIRPAPSPVQGQVRPPPLVRGRCVKCAKIDATHPSALHVFRRSLHRGARAQRPCALGSPLPRRRSGSRVELPCPDRTCRAAHSLWSGLNALFLRFQRCVAAGKVSATPYSGSCPVDIRCIANVLLLTSALLVAPPVSPAQSQSTGSGKRTDCLATLLAGMSGDTGVDLMQHGAPAQCAGGPTSEASRFQINLDRGDPQGKVAVKAALAIDVSPWPGSTSIAGDHRAQVRRGQRLLRK